MRVLISITDDVADIKHTRGDRASMPSPPPHLSTAGPTGNEIGVHGSVRGHTRAGVEHGPNRACATVRTALLQFALHRVHEVLDGGITHRKRSATRVGVAGAGGLAARLAFVLPQLHREAPRHDVDCTGRAKVRELCGPVRGYQDVGGLEVAMRETSGMHDLHGVPHVSLW